MCCERNPQQQQRQLRGVASNSDPQINSQIYPLYPSKNKRPFVPCRFASSACTLAIPSAIVFPRRLPLRRTHLGKPVQSSPVVFSYFLCYYWVWLVWWCDGMDRGWVIYYDARSRYKPNNN